MENFQLTAKFLRVFILFLFFFVLFFYPRGIWYLIF